MYKYLQGALKKCVYGPTRTAVLEQQLCVRVSEYKLAKQGFTHSQQQPAGMHQQAAGSRQQAAGSSQQQASGAHGGHRGILGDTLVTRVIGKQYRVYKPLGL